MSIHSKNDEAVQQAAIKKAIEWIDSVPGKRAKFEADRGRTVEEYFREYDYREDISVGVLSDLDAPQAVIAEVAAIRGIELL